MKRIDTATAVADLFGTGKSGFTDGNPLTPTPATQLSAAFFNLVQEEICRVIEAGGGALDGAKYDQLLTALRSSKFMSATAAGTANALTADFSPDYGAWTDGMPLYVRAAAANTSTTPTIAIDSLAAKTIVKGNGLALVAGDIAGAGHWLELQYDATLDKVVLQNPATGVSAAQFASAAEAQAYSVANKAISPATLASALQGANQSLATSGYQKLPGGLIIQWGKIAAVATDGTQAVTFPIAFPTGVLSIMASHMQSAFISAAIGYGLAIVSYTTSGFTLLQDGSATNATNEMWLALGY